MKRTSILPAWSIASPGEIEQTARELMRVRDLYLASDDSERIVTPRPLIKRSWERCRAARVDSSRRCAPLTITRDAQLEEIRDVNEPLLRAGRSAVERLADHLAGSGYVVVLADAKGSILEVIGDQGVRRRLAQIDFVPGGDWSELSAGTNAIGTALTNRHAVQLMGAEHFCDGWTDLTCTAAPIRNPFTGDVLGVLDVTGNYRLIRSHLTSLLAVTALDIEERLREILRPAVEAERSSIAATWRPTPSSSGETPPASSSDSILLTIAGGAVTASLDVALTMRSVAEQTATLLHVESSGVCLFAERPDGARFSRVWTSRATTIPRAALAHLLANCDAIAQLRERGEPIIVDDISNDPLFNTSDMPLVIRSIALFPLVTPRGIIGFVAAARPTTSHWSFGDLRRAFALMSQASTAIENALLFESLRRQFRHMKALNAISQLLGEVLDPSEHLPALVESIVRVMDCATGSLWISRGENRRFIRAFTDHDGAEGSPTALARHVHRAGHLEVAHAVEYDSIAVPLLDEAGTFGVFELEGRKKRTFEADDIETVTAIVQQLAMSLKNSELQRAARELDVLRRTDRLKSEFLATVSHDLRSPLTAIRASVDGLLDQPLRIRPHASDGFLHTISNQVNRLTRLVDQLLDVSQIEAGGLRLDREWNELHALLAYAVDDIAALHGRNRIAYAAPLDAPLLFVDHDRFIQVLYNLLDNACKHASPGPISIEARWTGTAMTIGVADRGPGIAASDIDHIFKRFHRGEEARGHARGSGLGLAICRGIVEAHGGTIRAESRVGGGAIFSFDIPLVPALEPEPVR
ncbi:MAG: ATP-binding protein [Vulcanimicrobiaceae bacterium]